MKKIIIIFLLLMFSYQASSLLAIPPFQQRVVDTSTTLTLSQIQTLEELLVQFESTHTDGTQIAVLIVPTLESEDIAQYALRVFDSWQIGQAKRDNGVLLLVAKDDHEVRIEVGYGLEGNIPDLQARHIISQQIIPAFKQDDYYQGINDALVAIINRLDGDIADYDDGTSFADFLSTMFAYNLMYYGAISLGVCCIISRILPFAALKKSVGYRNIIAGGLNGLAIGVFVFLNGYPISLVLKVTFLAFVVSTIICGLFSTKGGSGSGRSGGGGGNLGGRGGGFSGGGGGRSGGGGASGRW